MGDQTIARLSHSEHRNTKNRVQIPKTPIQYKNPRFQYFKMSIADRQIRSFNRSSFHSAHTISFPGDKEVISKIN